jgi:hypothetical protein
VVGCLALHAVLCYPPTGRNSRAMSPARYWVLEDMKALRCAATRPHRSGGVSRVPARYVHLLLHAPPLTGFPRTTDQGNLPDADALRLSACSHCAASRRSKDRPHCRGRKTLPSGKSKDWSHCSHSGNSSLAIHKTVGSSPPSGYRKAQLHIHRSKRSVRSASSDSTELCQNVFCRTQFRSRGLALALN